MEIPEALPSFNVIRLLMTGFYRADSCLILGGLPINALGKRKN
jgi:hypothetical protein